MAQMAELIWSRAELPAAPGADPMASLMQLHTLKALTKLSKRCKDDSDSDQSDKGKGLKELHWMRQGL